VACVSPQRPRDSHPWVSSPRLLISVRDASEISAALAGGADIIDVKDPDAGSLGRPTSRTVIEVAEALAETAPQPPLSVALGELTEWNRWRHFPLPTSVQWLKLGLAGCANDADWMSRWLNVRRRMEAEAGRGFGWIAVAYADHIAAQSPPPEAVLRAAIQTRCDGALIDTFKKRYQRLGDCITVESLASWLNQAREHGLQTAVAGSLAITDLNWLLPLRPDIVAVRTAVCQVCERTLAIDGDAVRRFHLALTGAPAISQS
jgi:uncharacterized protein (UPF0264 family)